MTKKESHNEVSVSSQVRYRSRFSHYMMVNLRYTVFNWTFYSSLLISILMLVINVFSNHTNSVSNFLNANSIEILSISISSVGIIIAAIAIIFIIFNPHQLSKIAKADDRTFEAFTVPYIWSSWIWCFNSLIALIDSIVSYATNSQFYYFICYIWLFILVYSILYSIYLIQQIFEYILFASLANDD